VPAASVDRLKVAFAFALFADDALHGSSMAKTTKFPVKNAFNFLGAGRPRCG